MSKPDDVSQEAWDSAKATYPCADHDEYGNLLRIDIARAIMAAKAEEREECAQIVEARIKLFTSYGSGLTGRNALKEATNSIRSRT